MLLFLIFCIIDEILLELLSIIYMCQLTVLGQDLGNYMVNINHSSFTAIFALNDVAQLTILTKDQQHSGYEICGSILKRKTQGLTNYSQTSKNCRNSLT